MLAWVSLTLTKIQMSLTLTTKIQMSLTLTKIQMSLTLTMKNSSLIRHGYLNEFDPTNSNAFTRSVCRNGLIAGRVR